MSDGRYYNRVIAIIKAKNLVMPFASFFAACKYGYAEHSFGYAQFDIHESDFIVPFSASLVEEASNVGLARLTTLCGSDLVMSLLALKRSAKVDWGQYVGDELPFPGYDCETEVVSDIVASRASKRPEVVREILLDVLGREVDMLKVTFYASIRAAS